MVVARRGQTVADASKEARFWLRAAQLQRELEESKLGSTAKLYRRLKLLQLGADLSSRNPVAMPEDSRWYLDVEMAVRGLGGVRARILVARLMPRPKTGEASWAMVAIKAAVPPETAREMFESAVFEFLDALRQKWDTAPCDCALHAGKVYRRGINCDPRSQAPAAFAIT